VTGLSARLGHGLETYLERIGRYLEGDRDEIASHALDVSEGERLRGGVDLGHADEPSLPVPLVSGGEREPAPTLPDEAGVTLAGSRLE
jgi:hypothetical protein